LPEPRSDLAYRGGAGKLPHGQAPLYMRSAQRCHVGLNRMDGDLLITIRQPIELYRMYFDNVFLDLNINRTL